MNEDHNRLDDMFQINSGVKNELFFLTNTIEQKQYTSIIDVLNKNKLINATSFIDNYFDLDNYCINNNISPILLKNVNSLYFLIAFTIHKMKVTNKQLKEILNILEKPEYKFLIKRVYIIKYYRFFKNKL